MWGPQEAGTDKTCWADGQCHYGKIPVSQICRWRHYSHSNATGYPYATMLPCHSYLFCETKYYNAEIGQSVNSNFFGVSVFFLNIDTVRSTFRNNFAIKRFNCIFFPLCSQHDGIELPSPLSVFVSHPAAVFGASHLLLAPSHPLNQPPYQTQPDHQQTQGKQGQINSMTQVIFNLIIVLNGQDISCEIAHRWFSVDLNYDKSTSVQVKAWCHWATSHYLSQCWPRTWPIDAIWWQRFWSTMVQVMASCLMASNHYLNQCLLLVSEFYNKNLCARLLRHGSSRGQLALCNPRGC